jgi:hypothetical protein
LIFFFFFLVGLGFELRVLCLQSRHTTTWTTPPVHFCSGYFGDGVSAIICPDWLGNLILLISASQHWALSRLLFLAVYRVPTCGFFVLILLRVYQAPWICGCKFLRKFEKFSAFISQNINRDILFHTVSLFSLQDSIRMLDISVFSFFLSCFFLSMGALGVELRASCSLGKHYRLSQASPQCVPFVF